MAEHFAFWRELLDVPCSFFFVFASVSLDLLALCPRLSPSGPGGVTAAEERKQQRGEGLPRLSSCSSVCGVLPSLAEEGEEEELVPEEGQLMGRGEGKGRGEKRGAGAQVCDHSVHPLFGSRGRAGGWKSQMFGTAAAEKRVCTHPVRQRRPGQVAHRLQLEGGAERGVRGSFTRSFTASERLTAPTL